MSLIRYAARIHFAERVLEDALPEELRARRIAAPLVVTDADAGAALARMLDCIPDDCAPRLLDLSGTSGSAAIARAVEDALAEGWREADRGRGSGGCDGVIGLGGPVAMAAARVLAQEIAPASLPLVTVPTLPGPLGLDPLDWPARERRRRTPALLLPDVVFCDPSLVRPAAPARLAASGMDALVHCLEALVSNAWNPPADAMAVDGLRRCALWLERLVADPADAEAGCEMLAAALNGALAAQKGLGAIHAIAFGLETLAVPPDSHGLLHAALIGPVIAFNAPAASERLAIAAEALGAGEARALAPHLAELGARLGLPHGLGHLAMSPATVARVAAAAARARANRDNPRYATTADYRQMIQAAQ